MSHKPTHRILIAALAAALSLLLAVSALAALPKAGKSYRGIHLGAVLQRVQAAGQLQGLE